MNGPNLLLATIAVASIIIAALMSAGEAALQQVTRTAIHDATGARPDFRRRAAQLVADPAASARSMSFIRVVGEVAAIACLTLMISGWLDDWWLVLLAALVVGVVIALVVVRLSPRSLGRRNPTTVLFALSGVLWAAVRATRWLSRFADVRDIEPEQQLQRVVDRVNESEAIEEEDRELFRSVFELGQTLTREVMVPRTDMITTTRTTVLPKVLTLFLRSGFSRVPVTGVSSDDVVGLAYFKDVVRRLHDVDGARDTQVGAVMRPAIFVPESKPVDDLLRDMQSSASHMAMVIDEYGGIAGLVTIEDALEEIVGELTDEHDRPAAETQDLGGGVLQVPARIGIDELGELFGLDLDDDDVDTAAGLLAKAIGKVPLPGSSATVHGLIMVADEVEGRRKRLATIRVARADAGKDWSALLGRPDGTPLNLPPITAVDEADASEGRS